MIARIIPDVKDFMNQLLIQDTFDSMLLCEATLQTATTLSISGKLNMDFFDTEERELMTETTYASWDMVKPLIFQAIKGKKTPSGFKLVFMLPKEKQNALILKNNLPISSEDVAGLYFNIYYDNKQLSITSGTSLRVFTMDKRLEQLWDDSLLLFMQKHHIHLTDS